MSKNITLNSIFTEYADEYLHRYNVSDYEKKIINNIIECRTAAMGGREEECDSCGHKITLYNSCRNRHCPLCQFMKKEKWIMDKQNEVLPYQYFHAVFTIPDELNPIVIRNKKLLYKLLFDTVKESLNAVSGDKKYFGAKIGWFAILHTWGQTLNLHPHIHCVIPGGGYREDRKKWKEAKENFLLPVNVIKPKFKYYFLTGLKDLYKKGELELYKTGLEDKKAFQKLVDNLFKKEWVVYLKETFKNGNSVIKYLSRYTHRIAISNYRIKDVINNKVYFEYRDYKRENRKFIKNMDVFSFMRHFMLHIVPRRFVRIRYYGILSCRNKERSIDSCYEYYKKIRIKNKTDFGWKDIYLEVTGKTTSDCLCCTKGKMIFKKVLLPERSPP
jgi:hypothetical protein